MAKIIEWNDEQQKTWDEWVASRPPVIQDLCKRFPPYYLYRLKSTGHRVTLSAYSENGAITVLVTGEYNAVILDREVFGIQPDDLEVCELPSPDETLGTILTKKKDIDNFVNAARLSELFGKKE